MMIKYKHNDNKLKNCFQKVKKTRQEWEICKSKFDKLKQI